MILLIQQQTTPLYMTNTTTYMLGQLTESPIYMLCHRYSNPIIPKQQSTQQASLRSYDTTGNLIHYYTTMDTATLMI